MISAFARAAQVLSEPRYLESATRAAKFLRAHLYDEQARRFVEIIAKAAARSKGSRTIMRSSSRGLLDLYEASFDVEWLQVCRSNCRRRRTDCSSMRRTAAISAARGNDPSILLRMKEDNDSAEPAASSVAALNLLRLAQIRGRRELSRDARTKRSRAFARRSRAFPSAMPQMLVALDSA